MTWNYISGFFDGEGSIAHNGKGFRVTISQTNKEVLDAIKIFTKVGNVFEVTKRKEHWKDSWVYYIAKQEDVYYFLSKINRYIVVKKKQTELILPQLEKILKKQATRKNRRARLIRETKKLRGDNLSYRKIGEMLGIDWGYARRLSLK